MFCFDDNVYNASSAVERGIKQLSVYWVDHFQSHEATWNARDSDWRNQIRDEFDFPFLSNTRGKTLVYQESLEAILTADEIARRVRFYYRDIH